MEKLLKVAWHILLPGCSKVQGRLCCWSTTAVGSESLPTVGRSSTSGNTASHDFSRRSTSIQFDRFGSMYSEQSEEAEGSLGTPRASKGEWTVGVHSAVEHGVCHLSVSVESRCSSPTPFNAVPTKGATATRGYSSSSGSSIDVNGALAHMLSSRALFPSSPGNTFLQRADSIENAMTHQHRANADVGSLYPLKHADIKHSGEEEACKQKLAQLTVQSGDVAPCAVATDRAESTTTLSGGVPSAHATNVNGCPKADDSITAIASSPTSACTNMQRQMMAEKRGEVQKELELIQGSGLHPSSSAGNSEISLDHSLLRGIPRNASPASQSHQETGSEAVVQLLFDAGTAAESSERSSDFTQWSKCVEVLKGPESPEANVLDASRLQQAKHESDPSINQASVAASENWVGLEVQHQPAPAIMAKSEPRAQDAPATVDESNQQGGNVGQPAKCLRSAQPDWGSAVDGVNVEGSGSLEESGMGSTGSQAREALCTPGNRIAIVSGEQRSSGPGTDSTSPQKSNAPDETLSEGDKNSADVRSSEAVPPAYNFVVSTVQNNLNSSEHPAQPCTEVGNTEDALPAAAHEQALPPAVDAHVTVRPTDTQNHEDHACIVQDEAQRQQSTQVDVPSSTSHSAQTATARGFTPAPKTSDVAASTAITQAQASPSMQAWPAGFGVPAVQTSSAVHSALAVSMPDTPCVSTHSPAGASQLAEQKDETLNIEAHTFVNHNTWATGDWRERNGASFSAADRGTTSHSPQSTSCPHGKNALSLENSPPPENRRLEGISHPPAAIHSQQHLLASSMHKDPTAQARSPGKQPWTHKSAYWGGSPGSSAAPASRVTPSRQERSTIPGSQAYSKDGHREFSARDRGCGPFAQPAAQTVGSAIRCSKLATHPPYQPRTALFRPTSRIHTCKRPCERHWEHDAACSHQHGCTCNMHFLSTRCSDSLRRLRHQIAPFSLEQQRIPRAYFYRSPPPWSSAHLDHVHTPCAQSSDTNFCSLKPRLTSLGASGAYRHAKGRMYRGFSQHIDHDRLRTQVQCSQTHRDVEMIRELLEGC